MDTATQLITEHLDTWTASVRTKSSAGRGGGKKRELYGIKKLRELILELAVRGLLVPQDPEDEPASDLLKLIKSEKADLIKRGKIRKAKLPSFPTKDEEPYELPGGWTWAPLGVVGNVYNGNSISARVKEEKYTDVDGLPFIATKDVGYGFEALDYDNGIAIPVGEDKFKTARQGSVLICAEGGSAGKKCGITERDICFGNKLFANELHGGIEPTFILSVYLSPSFFTRFSESMTGIIGGISASKFTQLQIPLPPLAEQHRIVAKVDELMALCDRLEQEQSDHIATHETLVKTLLDALVDSASDAAIFQEAWQRIAEHFDALFTTEASIDQLKQSILQLAVMGKLVPQDPNDEPARVTGNSCLFGSDAEPEAPFEIPLAWAWSNLDQLATINGGFAFKSSDYTDEGTRVVRISDFDEHGFKNAKVVRHSFSPELEKFSLRDGDILMAMTGGTVGKSLHVRALSEPMLVNQRVATIRASEACTSNYLNILIQSELTQEVIHEAKNSTNDNISMRDIKGFLVPLPPLAEQHRIVAKVDELMALCDALKAKLQSTQATQLQLTDSLVEQAVG